MPDGNLMPPFSADNQPDQARAKEGASFARSIKKSMLDAYDILGATAWLVQFAKKNDENARVFVNKLLGSIPLEVHGSVDTTLTVKVVTQLGEHEIEVKRPNNLPPRANSPSLIPVSRLQGHAVEDPPSSG